MNKIVFNFGLLVFCIAIIFFGLQKKNPVDTIIYSALIAVFVTILAALLLIVFIRSINRRLEEKAEEKMHNDDIESSDDMFLDRETNDSKF